MEGTDVDGGADCGLHSTSVAVAVGAVNAGVVEAADLAEHAVAGDKHLLLLEVDDYLVGNVRCIHPCNYVVDCTRRTQRADAESIYLEGARYSRADRMTYSCFVRVDAQ
jgi:hypothetical protein